MIWTWGVVDSKTAKVIPTTNLCMRGIKKDYPPWLSIGACNPKTFKSFIWGGGDLVTEVKGQGCI